MQTLAVVIFYTGAIIGILGYLGILYIAFSESVVWGLGCLCAPIVVFFFVFTHWEDAKPLFLVTVFGFLLQLAATFLGAA
ncbi:hypothetical protein HS125_06615 [bacterium]|nr:hypothetical protein [bacterium]